MRECHGSGTALGDPQRWKLSATSSGATDQGTTMLAWFREDKHRPPGGGAGAGFIKTVLALRHREIPNLHFQKINRTFDWSRRRSPFRPAWWSGGRENGRRCQLVWLWRRQRPRRSGGSTASALPPATIERPSAFTDPFREE